MIGGLRHRLLTAHCRAVRYRRLPSPGPTDTPTHQRHGWERGRRRRWGEGLLPAASKRKSRRAGFFPAGGDGSRKMAGKNPALHFPPKRGLQQPLKEMLRLAQRLPLLGAQATPPVYNFTVCKLSLNAWHKNLHLIEV